MGRPNPKSRKNMQPKNMRMSVLSRKIAENRSKLKEVLARMVMLEQIQKSIIQTIGEYHPEEENKNEEKKEEIKQEDEPTPEQEDGQKTENEQEED